jgi:hypothetical protein
MLVDRNATTIVADFIPAQTTNQRALTTVRSFLQKRK